jgi:DNA-binding NtrC family response regulator
MNFHADHESTPLKAGPAARKVLVVDDEAFVRDLCRDVATESGLQVHTASTTELALEILEQFPIGGVITDLRVPQLGGLELLKRVREKYPQVPVIVLTQFGTIESAVEATHLGAIDFVAKPFHVDELREKLGRLIRVQEFNQEKCGLPRKQGSAGLIGVSRQSRRVFELIEKVSELNCPVLILGESGTGKELVARSIHLSGPRLAKPFVPVDCSALVPTLIESELFGYVKGAFTGAMSSKQGLIESADTGTLFLDEIGNLSLDLQAKLLRALQEKEIKPVGSTERISFTSRVIAATNLDLESAVRVGGFRQDLYFRLNVVQIKLAPLRERKADIPLLVTEFLRKFSGLQHVVHLSEGTMACLIDYDWPGNVRELENAIEHAVALRSGPVIHVSDLPMSLQEGGRVKQSEEAEDNAAVPLEEIERRAILRAIRKSGGNKVVASRLLKIGKTTLYRKLKQYGK